MTVSPQELNTSFFTLQMELPGPAAELLECFRSQARPCGPDIENYKCPSQFPAHFHREFRDRIDLVRRGAVYMKAEVA